MGLLTDSESIYVLQTEEELHQQTGYTRQSSTRTEERQDEDVLDILSLALRCATTGNPLIGERQLEVDVIAVEGLTIVGTDGIGVDAQITELIIAALHLACVARLGVRQGTDRRDAASVRAQAKISDSYRVLS